jgi:hypothetical protein
MMPVGIGIPSDAMSNSNLFYILGQACQLLPVIDKESNIFFELIMSQFPASTVVNGADIESYHPHMVDFDGPDDKDIPLNWPLPWKIWVTSAVAILNLIGTVASSIFGTGSKEFRREFRISHEVAVLWTTLFLAVGSLPICYLRRALYRSARAF